MPPFNPIYTWPLAAFGTETSTVRGVILAAVDMQLRTITIANGYLTDLGSHVHEWDDQPLDLGVETLALDYKDETESRIDATVGEQDIILPVTIRIRTAASTALADIREMLADVARAMYLDPTFGSLANDTTQDGTAKVQKATAADVSTEATINFKIEYSVARGAS